MNFKIEEDYILSVTVVDIPIGKAELSVEKESEN